MISLLIAIFGKNRIPNSVRYIFLVIGLSVLAYKLKKFRNAQNAYKEALAIKYVMDKKIAAQAKEAAGQTELPLTKTPQQPPL